jgi:hypothetical protein
MTYKEWFTQTASRFGIQATDVDLILVNREDLIPDADGKVDTAIAKRALCAEFAAVIPLANVSEGGYSVSWNWEAIKFWYNQTCAELGITPADKPRVKNRSNRW